MCTACLLQFALASIFFILFGVDLLHLQELTVGTESIEVLWLEQETLGFLLITPTIYEL